MHSKAEALKEKSIDGINSEFDEDGFIYTYKERTKKIEFLGFDKHWKRINQLDQVQEMSVNDRIIRDFGKIGSLRALGKNMVNLSLESNLLISWEQVIHLGTELPNLQTLNISYNRLELPENFAEKKRV